MTGENKLLNIFTVCGLDGPGVCLTCEALSVSCGFGRLLSLTSLALHGEVELWETTASDKSELFLHDGLKHPCHLCIAVYGTFGHFENSNDSVAQFKILTI